MEPKNFHYGGGIPHTLLHPLVLAALLISIALILILPRRKVIAPLLWIAIMVPVGQQVFWGGMHWIVLRIVIAACCVRLLMERYKNHRRLLPYGMNEIDRAFIVFAIAMGVGPLLLFHTVEAVPGQVAFWLEAFGGYFFLRYLIADEEDIIRVFRTMALIALTLGLCMLNESMTHINVFGYLHSVPLQATMRDGIVRASACFAHPILAGCIGATLLPCFYWLWKYGGAKWLAICGAIGSVLMVLFSASSTSLLAMAGAIGALCFWPLRRAMRQIRWGLVVAGICLYFGMKAPVWFLIARVNVIGSSDAYSRAMLIDTFVRHFWDWWLIGADSGKWGYDMWDLSNRYVGVGETGGLVAFIAFIMILFHSFSKLGSRRRKSAGHPKWEWLYWTLGAVLFTHALCFFGVSYFDQTVIWWYASLAMVSAAVSAPHLTSLRTVAMRKEELAVALQARREVRGLPVSFRGSIYARPPVSAAAGDVLAK